MGMLFDCVSMFLSLHDSCLTLVKSIIYTVAKIQNFLTHRNISSTQYLIPIFKTTYITTDICFIYPYMLNSGDLLYLILLLDHFGFFLWDFPPKKSKLIAPQIKNNFPLSSPFSFLIY